MVNIWEDVGMPQIALTTFLKLSLFDEKRKRREYGKYLRPGGGYDFYWSLKKCVSEMTFGGKTYDYCVGHILNPLKNAPERTNNTAGLQSFVKWLEGRDRQFFMPPEGVYASPKGHLKIKLRPEFGIFSNDQRNVVAIWNTKEPALTRFMAVVGIHLMEAKLKAVDFEDCKFTLLDLRKPFWYRSEVDQPYVAKFVVDELDWVDNFFEENEGKKAA